MPVVHVSIPSLAGQTARRSTSAVCGRVVWSGPSGRACKLAGQTARLNPLFDEPDLPIYVSIPSLAGQTARPSGKAILVAITVTGFNPLISGADRAAQDQVGDFRLDRGPHVSIPSLAGQTARPSQG